MEGMLGAWSGPMGLSVFPSAFRLGVLLSGQGLAWHVQVSRFNLPVQLEGRM